MTVSPLPVRARVARHFHEEYEHLAVVYGWETQDVSRVPWEKLPSHQRALMVHVIGNLEAEGVISINNSGRRMSGRVSPDA